MSRNQRKMPSGGDNDMTSNRRKPYFLFLTLLFTAYLENARAAQSLEFGDLQIGARLQSLYIYSDSNVISDRDQSDFLVRRARLNAKGSVNSWIRLGMQTEFAEDPKNSSADARIIDAYAQFIPDRRYQFILGEYMAPALRQNLTQSNALLAMDRPGVIYKSQSWGSNAKTRFDTLTMNNTDAGLRGNVAVRDMGVTLFGVNAFNDSLHIKYYAGVYDGAQSATGDRFTTRVQVNVGDGEDGYYNSSYYSGNIDTVALGLSYDTQSHVAVDAQNGKPVDYRLISLDIFAEKPALGGSVCAEAALIQLDLGDANQLRADNSTSLLSTTAARSSAGKGGYLQLGYTKAVWQPWIEWERWQSDSPLNEGSYRSARLGLSYTLVPNKATLKLAYEETDAESAFVSEFGSDTRINSVAFGVFLSL